EQDPRKHKANKIKVGWNLFAEVHVVKRPSLPLEVKCSNHRGGIVDEMRQYRQPDILSPQQHVPEQCPEQHPRQESVKLEVYGTENDGGDPHGRMRVAEPTHEDTLYAPPEQELFADGGDNGHHEEVDNKAPISGVSKEYMRQPFEFRFLGFHPVLQARQCLGQYQSLVKLNRLLEDRG